MAGIYTDCGKALYRQCGRKAKWLPACVLMLGAWSMSGPLKAQEEMLSSRLPEQAMEGLREVLEGAMTESFETRLRDLVEEDYAARDLIAQAPRKISFGGGTTYRKEWDFRESDPSLEDRLFYSLTLSKSLYHWGALEANRDKGRLSLEMEELRSFEAYRLLALEARSRYLGLLVAQKNIALSEKSLSLAKKHLELERGRLERGEASELQVETLGLEVDAYEIELMKKRNELQDQILGLARLTGVPDERIARELPEELPRREILTEAQIDELSHFFDAGLEQSSRVQESSKRLELAEKELVIANQRLKPKIGLSLGLTQYEMDERGARRPEEIVYGGVVIRWDVFDGGASRGYQLSAASRIEQVRQEFERAKSTYRFELERAQRLLRLRARILAKDEDSGERARRRLAEVRADLESGKASFLQSGSVERSLAAQEIRTHQSRAEYFDALAEMCSLLGVDPFAQRFIASRSK